MSIKSLTDPKGDLTIYCKDILKDGIKLNLPGQRITEPLSVSFGGAGIVTLETLVVSYKTIDSSTILRTVDAYFFLGTTVAGDHDFQVSDIDDTEIPSEYSLVDQNTCSISGSPISGISGSLSPISTRNLASRKLTVSGSGLNAYVSLQLQDLLIKT